MNHRFDPNCTQIGTSIRDEDLLLHSDQPVCDNCGLPYYYAYLSGSWLHPFELNGQIIGGSDIYYETRNDS